MKVKKEEICILIRNEFELNKAKELLERYGQKISLDGTFSLTSRSFNYLQVFIDGKWWLGSKSRLHNQTDITLNELEDILTL